MQNNFNKEELINNLDNLLNDSISRRMVADVPVGAFLSGGRFNNCISNNAENSNKKIKTFSIGFEESSYDEAHFAKKLQKNYELTITSFI